MKTVFFPELEQNAWFLRLRLLIGEVHPHFQSANKQPPYIHQTRVEFQQPRAQTFTAKKNGNHKQPQEKTEKKRTTAKRDTSKRRAAAAPVLAAALSPAPRTAALPALSPAVAVFPTLA